MMPGAPVWSSAFPGLTFIVSVMAVWPFDVVVVRPFDVVVVNPFEVVVRPLGV